MKNTKYFRFVVLALSIAILMGSAIGIATSAESAENSPKILGKNIEYSDTLKFMVAVDPDSVGGAEKTVTFSVYEGDPANGKILGKPVTAEYKDTSETNLGVANAYVATSVYGVSPLAYGENYYLVVECDGVKTTTQYSAIEYFLERLYGDNIVNAKEEADLYQKGIYENAIAYGSYVQKYAAYEGKFRGTNIEKYKYITVDGGTANGVDSGVFEEGTTLTLSENTRRWAATTIVDGKESVEKLDANSYIVKDHATIATYIDLPYSYFTTQIAAGEIGFTYEGLTFDKLCVRSSNPTYAFLDKSGQCNAWESNTFVASATVNNESVFTIGKNGGNHLVPELAFYNINSTDKNCVVFESDVMFSAANTDQITGSSEYFSRFGFTSTYDKDGNYAASYYKDDSYLTTNKMLHMAEVVGSFDPDTDKWGELKYSGQTFESGKWYKIAMEYYKAEGVIKYYVDGYLINTVTVDANLECTNVVFQLQGMAYGSRIYVDNTYFGTVDKTLAE